MDDYQIIFGDLECLKLPKAKILAAAIVHATSISYPFVLCPVASFSVRMPG